jgi:hypothetical protein
VRPIFVVIPVVFIFLAVLISLASAAEEEPPTDDIVFFSRFDNRTEIVYMGEWEIGLDVYFSQNHTNWEVACKSELFVGNLSGRTLETCEGPHWLGMGISLDRNERPGVYQIPVYLNYTDDNGTRVEKVFDLRLEYVKAVEIIDFRITRDDDLEVELELFIPCDKLVVMFDTDGGLEVGRSRFSSELVEPGVYTFSTELEGGTVMSRDDDPEVAYHVLAHFGARTVEFSRYNVPPEEVMVGGGINIVLLALVVVLMAGAIGVVLVWRGIKSQQEKGDEDSK